MIPIDQTMFGEDQGDCLSACLASILEIPLEDVPYFADIEDNIEFYKAINAWLRPYGYFYLTIEPGGVEELNCWGDYYAILSGPAERPWGEPSHAVVARGGELVHDPNPNYGRTGIKTITGINFLVPLDPLERRAQDNSTRYDMLKCTVEMVVDEMRNEVADTKVGDPVGDMFEEWADQIDNMITQLES